MAFSKSLRKRKTLRRRGGAAAANATPTNATPKKAAPKKSASAKSAKAAKAAIDLKRNMTEKLKSVSAKRLEAKQNNNLWGNYRAAKALSNQAKAPSK